MRRYRDFIEDLREKLKDPEEAARYLNAVIEENDLALLLAALADVARAHGISRMAKRAALSRVGLHKTISKKGNPELRTFMSIIKASGLQLSFKAA